MLSKITFLALILASFVAQATSLSPCTPIVHAQPSRLNCVSGDDYYSIVIDTYMSTSSCPYEQRIEVQTAKISLSNKAGTVSQELTAAPGTFRIDYKNPGSASFTSAELGLDLQDCIYPMNGSVSLGNLGR